MTRTTGTSQAADRAIPGASWRGVSVLMCAHNEAQVIDRQLRALATQEADEAWELIVVDDRSTDATGEIVEAWRDRFPRLVLLRLDSGTGLSYARNHGIRTAAQSDKLLMCDADDEVQPGWLRAMSRALDHHDLVGARLDPTGINPQWLVRTRGLSQTQALPTYLGLPWSYGGALGFRRLVFDTIGGFDEGLVGGGEDCDFGVRAAAAGFRCGFVPDAAVRYRFRPDAASSYRQALTYGRSEALLLRRYGAPSDRRSWWRYNTIELLRLPVLLASTIVLRDRLDRRVHAVAYARRTGRMIGRFHGAVRYGCHPW